jgi:hypothetical protein
MYFVVMKGRNENLTGSYSKKMKGAQLNYNCCEGISLIKCKNERITYIDLNQ